LANDIKLVGDFRVGSRFGAFSQSGCISGFLVIAVVQHLEQQYAMLGILRPSVGT